MYKLTLCFDAWEESKGGRQKGIRGGAHLPRQARGRGERGEKAEAGRAPRAAREAERMAANMGDTATPSLKCS